MANAQNQHETSLLPQGQIYAIVVMLLFTIMISWRLMAGTIAPAQAFLWLGACCLCPIGWYCFGYLLTSDKTQSNALLVSAIGWVFVAIGFLVHYQNVLDVDPGTATTQVSYFSLSMLLLLGLFILVVGGLLSWQAVTKTQSLDTKPTP